MSKVHTFVVLDTETGGLSSLKHSIIEIAAQVIEVEHIGGDRGLAFRYGEHFEAMCRPVLPVSEEASKINGYSEEKWMRAGSEREVVRIFFDWVSDRVPKGAMWCGSNPAFDLEFLEVAARRNNMLVEDRSKNMVMPTLNMSHRKLNLTSVCMPLLLLDEVDGVGLRHLRKWAECEGEQAHRAMADVKDTIVVLKTYLDMVCRMFMEAPK